MASDELAATPLMLLNTKLHALEADLAALRAERDALRLALRKIADAVFTSSYQKAGYAVLQRIAREALEATRD
jgi:hypothetical protein